MRLTIVLLSAFLLISVSTAGETPTPTLVYSTFSDRREPLMPVEGEFTEAQEIYVFVPDTDYIKQVWFLLDGDQVQLEKRSEYDFKGTAGDGDAYPFQVSSLSNGQHNITAVVTYEIHYNYETRYIKVEVSGLFTVNITNGGGSDCDEFDLYVSHNERRTYPALLNGTIELDEGMELFIFLSPDTNVKRAVFSLSTDGGAFEEVQEENRAPFDYAGTNSDGTADGAVFDTASYLIRTDIDFHYEPSCFFETAFSVEAKDVPLPPCDTDFYIVYSTMSYRDPEYRLDGQMSLPSHTDLYIYLQQDVEDEVDQVRFFLGEYGGDSFEFIREENVASYDYAGTASGNRSKPTQFSDGYYVIKSDVKLDDYYGHYGGGLCTFNTSFRTVSSYY